MSRLKFNIVTSIKNNNDERSINWLQAKVQDGFP